MLKGKVFMDIYNLSLDIKFCHISYHDENWKETKTKADYTIWNIISGELVLYINGQTLRSVPGDVLLFHPGDKYSAWAGADHCYFLVTFFYVSIGNSIDYLKTATTSGLYHGKEIKLISDRFCMDYKKYYESSNNVPLGLYASFLTFFSSLSAYFGSQIPFNENPAVNASSRLISLIEYIDSNTEKNITVREMAKFMDMSEKYFSSYFRLNVGMTPKNYLVKCKMKYACELLKNKDNSIQDVGLKLGFADQYSFGKAFKNYYGEAPGKFRNHYITLTPPMPSFSDNL